MYIYNIYIYIYIYKYIYIYIYIYIYYIILYIYIYSEKNPDHIPLMILPQILIYLMVFLSSTYFFIF